MGLSGGWISYQFVAQVAYDPNAHRYRPTSGSEFRLAGVSGLLGARLWYLGENWSEVKHDLLGALLSSAGFTFYGGFIIGSLVVLYLARRDGTEIGKFCDSLGPCLSLGYAIGRLGCQLSGDGDYGIATSGFWGMSYSTGIVPTPPGVLVYPTPLFESTISLLVLWFLSRIEVSSTAFTGRFQRFGLYLVLISLERLCVEGFRVNPVIAGGMSEAQIIALVLITLGSVLMLRGARHKATVR
jgi:phosphatidylglycerol:prolipoprotein diacylglycerol transferase